MDAIGLYLAIGRPIVAIFILGAGIHYMIEYIKPVNNIK